MIQTVHFLLKTSAWCTSALSSLAYVWVINYMPLEVSSIILVRPTQNHLSDMCHCVVKSIPTTPSTLSRSSIFFSKMTITPSPSTSNSRHGSSINSSSGCTRDSKVQACLPCSPTRGAAMAAEVELIGRPS
jgi:hypothetical protein